MLLSELRAHSVLREKLLLRLGHLLIGFSLELHCLDGRQQLIHHVSLQNQNVFRVVEDFRSDSRAALSLSPKRSALHVIVNLRQLNMLVLDQLGVGVLMVLVVEDRRHGRLIQDRGRLTTEQLAEHQQELAQPAVLLLVGVKFEHPVCERVSLVDEAFAEALEAQRESLALLTLEAHADDGKGVATAALILMHHQLRLLKSDQEQKEIRVAGKLGALVRRPQVHERELAHAIDARVVFKHLDDNALDDFSVKVQRLAEIRQKLPEDVDELLVARSRYATVVVLGDVEVGVDQLMIRVDRRKLAENQHCQLQLHQRKVRLTLRIEDVPEEVAQDRDGVRQAEVLVLDVEAGFLGREEDIVDDVGQLTRADTPLRRSLLMLLNDRQCALEWNAKR